MKYCCLSPRLIIRNNGYPIVDQMEQIGGGEGIEHQVAHLVANEQPGLASRPSCSISLFSSRARMPQCRIPLETGTHCYGWPRRSKDQPLSGKRQTSDMNLPNFK